MGLFGLFKKADELIFVKRLAEPDEDQEHLTAEGDLPWGWHTENKSFTDKVKSEYNAFLSAWITSKKSQPLAQYNALKSFVVYMNDVKLLCESKGECFVYWRDELFTDDYLKKRTEELDALERTIK